MARALLAASNWDAAAFHLEAAREPGLACRPPLTPSVDALAAHVATGRGQFDEAKTLAERAEQADLWEVACDALEVLGRLARERDLQEAEKAFDRARQLAEQHDLAIWRMRAMHELGTIDIFTAGAGPGRLQQAQELAEQAGAWA
jgi:tetratricopeptide (TPR) repeat protein